VRALVAGAGGQLGRALQDCAPAGVTVIAPSEAEFDITDAATVARVIADSRVDVVFNAAAYTAVDKAEADKLSDLEKAQKAAKEYEEKANAAEQKLRTTNLRMSLMAEAGKAGAADAEIVADLLSGKQWEYDADGRPVGVEAAVKELLKAKPVLVAVPASASSTNAPKGLPTGTSTLGDSIRTGSDVMFGVP
jgi:hypothetical protein